MAVRGMDSEKRGERGDGGWGGVRGDHPTIRVTDSDEEGGGV